MALWTRNLSLSSGRNRAEKQFEVLVESLHLGRQLIDQSFEIRLSLRRFPAWSMAQGSTMRIETVVRPSIPLQW